MIRRLSLCMVAVAVIAMALVGCVAAADDTSNDHVIHATGSGNIIGTPDRAQITFSVQTENADVKVAQADNALKMNNVINALVNAGIPRDALKTTGYNIYPVYEDTKTPFDQKVKTYQVTNTLTVTLHDVSKTGEVIDVAVANGINQATSIQFMLSDEQSQVLRTQALQKAVTRARADADTVAAAMGTNITGVKNADISGGYSPVLYQNYQYDAGASLKAVAVPTPIQPGDVTVTASVTITYTIR
ncbi:SIMPL domain-containing protein [uncultured Methanoregula sp.]|uniref:SIMPL domain-containing protein n=1 Tax=uncultured Methanoregula sp. TaxID=1005933 RepID=UPI002AAAC7B6|nr:SIMPL domain-containing protein [uncultured Methanoregula sp.]